MFCTKCGAELEENVSFCPECGSAVEAQTEEEISAQTETAATASTAPEQSFDWQAVSQPQPSQALNLEKPENNSKAAYIVMGVIGVAILIALVYLVLSLTGVGSPKASVQKAFLNTWSDLTEKDEYTKMLETIMENEQISEEFALTVTDFSMTEYGETITIPEFCQPIRFAMTGVTDMSATEMYLDMTAGLGDMQDIQIEAYIDNEGYLLGLGDLYPDYFAVSMDELTALTGMDFSLEDSMESEKAQEALNSLGESLSKWAVSVYNDVECKKNKKTTISNGDREMEAQEYYLWMSIRNYKKHLQKLPAAIEEAEAFMSWLQEVMPEEADEFIGNLEAEVSEMVLQANAADIAEIAYVYVNDGKVVQILVPLDSEEDNISGTMKVSFFGTKNVSDDFRIFLDLTKANENVNFEYIAVTNGAEEVLTLDMSMNDATVNMVVDGRYEVSKDSCNYLFDEITMAVDLEEEEGLSFSVSLAGNYGVAKAAAIESPDKAAAKQLLEIDETAAQEIVATVLDNMLAGGHVPSEWKDSFSMIKDSIAYSIGSMDFSDYYDYGDDGAGSLDGSENLTYEEFVEMVKATYGDMYSEEELKEIYDMMYGEGSYDTSDIVYGSSGLPYLFCEDEDLILEIQLMEGFTFAPDYSSSYAIEYEKMIGNDEEWLVMDYQIVEDSCEEYLAWAAEYWTEYYTEMGYTDVKIGETQYGMIGGYKTAWFEYNASAGDIRSMGIIAFAQIDELHGCVLDFYSLYGEQAPTVDMLYESFNLYQIATE